jgi:hypothetical protein
MLSQKSVLPRYKNFTSHVAILCPRLFLLTIISANKTNRNFYYSMHELPRLLAPDLPSHKYSLKGLTCTHFDDWTRPCDQLIILRQQLTAGGPFLLSIAFPFLFSHFGAESASLTVPGSGRVKTASPQLSTLRGGCEC